jgi:hypothetical protein
MNRSAYAVNSGAALHGNLRGALFQALGDLNISGCSAGDIKLSKAKVGGDVVLNDASISRDLRVGETGIAFCRNFMAEMIRCNGDAVFTGLAAGGDLRARGATVRGELLLAQPDCEEPWSHAQIKGKLVLTSVRANHLVLHGHNTDMEKDGEVRVILERGSFSRLTIIDPNPDPINLMRVRVGGWEFRKRGAIDARPDNPDLYVEVLEKMEPFDRSVWIDVERKFRNEARGDEADAIYVAMQSKQRDRNPVRRAYDYMTVYQTQVWRPMVPWALLSIVLFCVLIFPANVRVSASALETVVAMGLSGTVVADSSASEAALNLELSPKSLGQEWTILDAFGLTLRYAVPIAPIAIYDRWEAGSRPLVMGFTAERFAGIVSLWSWVAWPLFLIGFVAGAFRGKKE